MMTIVGNLCGDHMSCICEPFGYDIGYLMTDVVCPYSVPYGSINVTSDIIFKFCIRCGFSHYSVASTYTNISNLQMN